MSALDQFDLDVDDLRDLIGPIPRPTDHMLKIGESALDDYYAGTKDAPIDGSLAAVYRAMAALSPEREDDAHSVSLAASILRGLDYFDMASRLDAVAERLWPERLVELASAIERDRPEPCTHCGAIGPDEVTFRCTVNRDGLVAGEPCHGETP